MPTPTHPAGSELEAVLTVMTMALIASQANFDTQRFAALLAAASKPEAGLSPETGGMLNRLGHNAQAWARMRHAADPCEATSVRH